MRRKDREIFGEEIEDILKKGEYGILSTVSMDGKPYAVPISYAWKDGLIHLHCAANVGRKLDVILTGQIMPSKDKQASLIALLEKYSKDFLEKRMQYINAAKDKSGVYVIYPKRITGKANHTKYKKLKMTIT